MCIKLSPSFLDCTAIALVMPMSKSKKVEEAKDIILLLTIVFMIERSLPSVMNGATTTSIVASNCTKSTPLSTNCGLAAFSVYIQVPECNIAMDTKEQAQYQMII